MVATDPDILARDLGLAALSLLLAGWLVFLLLWDRYGRERGSAPHDADHGRRELPDDPPPLAHALLEIGLVRPESVVGPTVVDLAQRGWLTIVEDRGVEDRGGDAAGHGEWRFRRQEGSYGGLRAYENAVLARLFASGDENSLSALTAWARRNQPQARGFLERIGRYVEGELVERGYVEGGKRAVVRTNQVAAAVVGLVGLFALFSGTPLGLLGLASAGLQAFASRILRRRTAGGVTRSRRWREIATLLGDVEDTDRFPVEEPPARDLEGWERCLVYAVALGVGDRFLDGLRARDAAVARSRRFAAWYEGAGEGDERLRTLPAFLTSVGEALAEAAGTRAPRRPGASAPARLGAGA